MHDESTAYHSSVYGLWAPTSRGQSCSKLILTQSGRSSCLSRSQVGRISRKPQDFRDASVVQLSASQQDTLKLPWLMVAAAIQVLYINRLKTLLLHYFAYLSDRPDYADAVRKIAIFQRHCLFSISVSL